ncbi:MAG: ABC transporter substrate-binding protein [Roseovarius sp.]
MQKSAKPLRPIVKALVQQAQEGVLSRREFLALASTFGASAATAYGLLGMAVPSPAQAGTPQRGGVLRVGGRVMDIVDPRKFSWSEQGNIARCICESLVRWEEDATLAPLLLESWEAAEDAQSYTLNVRKGVTWTNGDVFDAVDVVHNLTRWCDTKAQGNSMASRMSALINPETGKAASDAIVQLDDYTVRLNLTRPDITLIAGMVDYPALMVHRSFGETSNLMQQPIGTGAFELVSLEIGHKAILKRRESGVWWGGEAHLDGVEFIDYGSDPTSIVAAFDAQEIDSNDETPADFVDALTGLGLIPEVRTTANTLVARMRVDEYPFDNKTFRNAIQMAVHNEITLILGIDGDGTIGENHHIAPSHPEYAHLPPPVTDPVRALEMARAEGLADVPFELVSIDGDWRTVTTDAIGAQLREAGFNITRKIIAGNTFWNAWTSYPFSTTSWGGRPLGVQTYVLAYKSGQPWNETGFSDPEFDALLDQAVGLIDADARREVMAKMQTILRESGVIIQPYWRNQTMHHTDAVHNYGRHQYRELHLEHVWMDV